MSDPVTNSEIEDVLSSIRRLVSDEPLARKPDAANTQENFDRLVLTPAFRVPDAPMVDEPAEDVAAEAKAEPEHAPEDDADVLVLAAPEPAEAAAAPEKYAEPEPEMVVPEKELAPEETDASAASLDISHALSDDEAQELPDAFEATEAWSDPVLQTPQQDEDQTAEAPQSEEQQTLEARIAELEAAIEQAPQDWEPDGTEDGLDDETRPLSADVDPLDGDTVDALADRLAGMTIEDDLPEPETETETETENARVETVEPQHEAEIEASDAPAAEPGPENDNDDAEGDTHGANVLDWQDDATEDALTEDVSDPAADSLSHLSEEGDYGAAADDESGDTGPESVAIYPQDAADTWDSLNTTDEVAHTESLEEGDALASAHDDPAENDSIATLDEDMLKEMVSDLVREELSGVLGERITRNVRRLVRREIQRALALRDLE